MQKYPQINVRIQTQLIKRIDDWRRLQDDLPRRPEAIRRLIKLGLLATSPEGRTVNGLITKVRTERR
jgi:hypothetical protein